MEQHKENKTRAAKIVPIIISERKAACEVIALQRVSYQVEAELIGTNDIPPLKETAEELSACGETFIGYYERENLAGVLSYKLNGSQIDLHRVMVHPDYFRNGIAGKLLDAVEVKFPEAREMIVSTGAENLPAVRLYEKLGFLPAGEIIFMSGLKIAHFKKQLK
ncbi:GNAT family N-acetyltransferase [Mesobacillus harenae]|uniref:GNAT family N-acetyltransferase n=1 Tax=Mesobacillus harenae TaxID=2213203 RepID=UPI001580D131|nr:GNAT family N-acetyltransferase [Mesobacillus harenae]